MLRWNSIFQAHTFATAESHHLVKHWIQGLVNDHKMNNFLFCAWKACTCMHTHTHTHILFFLSLHTKSVVLVIMLCAIYRANACPIVLVCWVGPRSPECSGHVKGNAEAVCWKAGPWIQERGCLAEPQVCILRPWIYYSKLGVPKLLIAVTTPAT